MTAYNHIDDTSEPGLAYWASYFINGDASGLTGDEIAEADAWLASVQPSDENQHAEIVDCSESYIGRFKGLIADVCDYTLVIYEREVYLPIAAPVDTARDLPYCGDELARYAWPGGYPITYLLADGAEICPDCANGRNGSDATQDPRQDDRQWRIVGCYVRWEGPIEQCAHCNADMESAYGDPDEQPEQGA